MLELRDLAKSYELRRHWYLQSEKREIFSGLNLTLAAGQNLLIAGRSGVGKSSLGRIIAGLERPSAGGVFLDGVSITRPGGTGGGIYYLFQDQKAALNPYKRLGCILLEDYAATRRGKKSEGLGEIQKLFSLAGLDPALLNSKPYALSGGEAARLGLVRALLARPRVLILDEITSNLDLINARKILGLLAKIQATAAEADHTQISLIFITHQTELLGDFDYEPLELEKFTALKSKGKG